MKIQRIPQHPPRGLMLIECIMYVALFTLVIGFAFRVFYDCWDNSKVIRQNSSQISLVLAAGEQWRQEVRQISQPIVTESSSTGAVCHLAMKSGTVDYLFTNNSVLRRTGQGEWQALLTKIKSSQMSLDRRTHATAWRWEVEFISQHNEARLKPYFTFEAVPSPARL